MSEFPPRVWIFKYLTEDGQIIIEADYKQFGQSDEQQYLSLAEHNHILAEEKKRAEGLVEVLEYALEALLNQHDEVNQSYNAQLAARAALKAYRGVEDE